MYDLPFRVSSFIITTPSRKRNDLKISLTTTVVDANGNTVANYNGNVTLTTTGNATAIQDPTNSANAGGTETVAAVNGVATFTVESTGNAANVSDTLTGSADYNGAALAQGQTTLTTSAAKATSLSLSASPSTIDVNNGNEPTTVNVQVLDQAGNPISGVSEPVTLTLTGPGSFEPGASVTSTAMYIDGSGSVTVYGMQNGTGTITVNASSTGLTAGSTAIKAITVGAPSQLAISSKSETTSTGTPFTLYTVQLEDASGNAITSGAAASGVVELSDNTGTVGGTLNYYSVNTNGQPGASLPMTATLTNGQLQFAVENTSAGTSPATITVKDISQNPNLSATAQYDFAVGSGSTVSLTPSTSQNVVPGQKVTVSAQLTDANGNNIKKAGVGVTFYFGSNGALATLPNGQDGTGSNNGYTATTNADGVATVSIAVPSGASPSQSFTVDAVVGTNAAVTGPTYTVEALANYATGMQYTSSSAYTPNSSPNNAPASWPPSSGSVTAGTPIASGLYLALTNGVGQFASSNDTLEITTSNPNVLALSANAGQPKLPAADGVAEMPTITPGLAGSATITVTDLSNPALSPITTTVQVNAATPSSNTTYFELLYQGSPISSSNPLSVTAGTPVALQVEEVGPGGNPVTVTGTNAAVVDLMGPAGSFRATSNGSSITATQIPVGSYMASVYFAPQSGTYTSEGGLSHAAAVTAGAFGAYGAETVGISAGATYTDPTTGNTDTLGTGGSDVSNIPVNTDVTVSGQETDANGAGIPNQTVTVNITGIETSGGSSKTIATATTTTNANGYYTV